MTSTRWTTSYLATACSLIFGSLPDVSVVKILSAQYCVSKIAVKVRLVPSDREMAQSHEMKVLDVNFSFWTCSCRASWIWR